MKLSSFGTWSWIARLSRRHARICGDAVSGAAPQHTLYFLPLPQGQLSLRPTFIGAAVYQVAGSAHPATRTLRLATFISADVRGAIDFDRSYDRQRGTADARL